MTKANSQALRQLLSELTLDFVDTQQYFSDLEPQAVYDTMLHGKLQALRGHVRSLNRPDLCEALDAVLPICGNAVDALTLVSDYVAPEIRSQLDDCLSPALRAASEDASAAFSLEKKAWSLIEEEFGITKRQFGYRIGFVENAFKRKVLFRDVAHAFMLARDGYSKPATILAGGIIEELLRLLLKSRGEMPTQRRFASYIEACGEAGELGAAVHKLADSVRHFRNMVHLEREDHESRSVTLSAAKGAVASIFTVVNSLRA